MNYEKKYKEIVGQIKKAYLYAQTDSTKAVLEEILPELAESEDEKVRKEIVRFIRMEVEDEIVGNKWLAWLGKQGTPAKLSEEEQNRFAKGVLRSCAMSFIDYLDAHKYEGKMCVSNGECEDIENAFHNAMWDRLHRYYCKYIEKQGQVKESAISQHENRTCEENVNSLTYEDERIRKEIINYFQCQSEEEPTRKEIHNKWIAWLERQGEKPDDKVEPKFKVGDLVVQNGLGIYKIIEVCESWYEVISYKDGIQYSIGFDKENDCHLWTIQDAKDGDVLKEDSCIFILEKIKSQDTAITHCCLFDDGDFNLSSKICFDVDSTYPATKEQRDTLLKAMADAGYIFDFEKKKLKNIVQKTEENKGNIGGISSNWSEED